MSLMADGIQIPIEALDQTTEVVNKIDNSLDGLNNTQQNGIPVTNQAGMSITELNSALEIGAKVLGVVKDAAVEAYGEYSTLAREVRDLALVSGQSAEEASIFIQVLDDFELSAADATTAAKFLKEQGLSPNIETLIMLSEQFKKIKDPAERLAFVQENLGKGGAKWVNILSQEESALRATAAEINPMLILTDEQIRKSEMARLAVDEWNDSLQALKVSFGAVIGEMIISNQLEVRATEIMDENNVSVMARIFSQKAHTDALAQARAEQEAGLDVANEATDGYESEADATKRLAEEAKAAADALREMTEANNDALSLTMSIAEETQNYNEKLAETITEYGEGSEEVARLKEEHAAAFLSMATDLEIAKLKADGFTDAEYNMAITMLEASGQIDGAAAATALAMDKIATAAQNAGEGGMKAYGDIIKTVMADGVISNEELQGALDTLNTETPQGEMRLLEDSFGTATDTGISSLADLQNSVDAFSTEAAVQEANKLRDALNQIPSLPGGGGGTGGQSPDERDGNGFSGNTRGGGGSGQVFQIQVANFYQNSDGSFVQI